MRIMEAEVWGELKRREQHGKEARGPQEDPAPTEETLGPSRQRKNGTELRVMLPCFLTEDFVNRSGGRKERARLRERGRIYVSVYLLRGVKI